MSGDRIQNSNPGDFLQQAFQASEQGSKRIVIESEGSNPDSISWRVETRFEKLKRVVSFSAITKQQNVRFVETLFRIAEKTGNAEDQQAAEVLAAEVESSPKLSRSKTAIGIAHATWSEAKLLNATPPQVAQAVATLRPEPPTSTPAGVNNTTPPEPTLAEREASINVNAAAKLASDLSEELQNLLDGPVAAGTVERQRWLASARDRVDRLDQLAAGTSQPEQIKQLLAAVKDSLNTWTEAIAPAVTNPSTTRNTVDVPPPIPPRNVSLGNDDAQTLTADLLAALEFVRAGAQPGSKEEQQVWLATAQSQLELLQRRIGEHARPEDFHDIYEALRVAVTEATNRLVQPGTDQTLPDTNVPERDTVGGQAVNRSQPASTLAQTFNQLAATQEVRQLIQTYPQAVGASLEKIFVLAEQVDRGVTAQPPRSRQELAQLRNEATEEQTRLAVALGQRQQSELVVEQVLQALQPFVEAIDARLVLADNTPVHRAQFNSVQDLIDKLIADSRAGVDLDSVQIDPRDLGGVDANLKVNGVPLNELVDPQTGQLPVRTALIAYGVGIPDQPFHISSTTQPLTNHVLRSALRFDPVPGRNKGVDDVLFSETKFAKAIYKHAPGTGYPAAVAHAPKAIPLSDIDYSLTSYDEIRVLASTAYPEFELLPPAVRDNIISSFAANAVGLRDPRFAIVLNQLAIFVRGLVDQGIDPTTLGERSTTQFGKLLELFREAPFAVHPRLANLLTDGRPDEVRRLHIYTPGPVYKHPETPELGDKKTAQDIQRAEDITHRARLLKLDPDNTIVIGNGGGGAAGLLQHLATRYQQSVTNAGGIAPTVVWRFGDSNQNFQVINHEDLAITYEPPEEKRLFHEGKLAQIRPAFFNHLELAAPPNPPFAITTGVTGGKVDDPVGVVAEIITKSIGLTEHGSPKKTYFSRYNASAVGTKDEILFRAAIKSVLAGPDRQRVLAKAGITPTASTPEQEIEAALYVRWIEHVHADRGASVIEAVDVSRKRNLFHLNDRAILLKEGVSPNQWLTQTANDPKAVLLNPAQLIGARHSLESPQTAKFVEWLTGPEGQAAVESFRLREGDSSQQTYASVGGTSFQTLLDNVPALERGSLIDAIWRAEAENY